MLQTINAEVIRFLEFVKNKHPEYSFDYAYVGGLAVIAHGYARMTQDLDVILQIHACVDQDVLLPHEREAVAFRHMAECARAFFPGSVEWSAPQPLNGFDGFKNGILKIDLQSGIYKRIDIIMAIRDYEIDGIANKIAIDEMSNVHVVDIPYLVLMKLLAFGPKDIEDVVQLLMLEKENGRLGTSLDIIAGYAHGNNLFNKRLNDVLRLIGEPELAPRPMPETPTRCQCKYVHPF